jgi:CheY-like chemotaxis protein
MTTEKLEVIVVDDKPENIDAVKQYFETRPEINVTYATTYDEAVNLMEEHIYAVSLFDLELPRKVDLGDLAKLMKVSTSTYQEHLRKAESKLLPFFSENIR